MMTTYPFNFNEVDSSWKKCVQEGLAAMDPAYLQHLTHNHDWLPGPHNIFNAFSLPVEKVNYVLFGESPYPRKDSANGYAFWDAAITDLWSAQGLNKKVNRATSMRNILKMLLIAEGLLPQNKSSQEAIAELSKKNLIQTNHEFFTHLLNRGFLLLNATLVLQEKSLPQKDARAWYPFMQHVIHCLLEKRPQVKFILFGKIANAINPLLTTKTDKLYAEHPYNLSFINNEKVINFFQPLHLLRK